MIKKFLKSVLTRQGLYVTKRITVDNSFQFKMGDFQYDVVAPSANYAPWLNDAEFQTIYNKAKANTLVDTYRSYELWELAEKIHQLNNTANFIEIGVWRGGTAAVIGRKLAMLQSTVDFFLADTFSGVVKASGKDAYYSGGEHADASKEIVDTLLAGIYSHYKVLVGIFPEDTAHLINENAQFGYCHIDVDVYDSARDVVDWIWPKMITGGVIIFDDYGLHYTSGITKYVNEQKDKADRIIVHNLNGHAVMIKLS